MNLGTIEAMLIGIGILGSVIAVAMIVIVLVALVKQIDDQLGEYDGE